VYCVDDPLTYHKLTADKVLEGFAAVKFIVQFELLYLESLLDGKRPDSMKSYVLVILSALGLCSRPAFSF